MKIHAVREMPSQELANSLATFETGFTYPLGPGHTFTIRHGDDYARFFRAMGPATCFIAELERQVLGALGVAIRPLLTPNGSSIQAAYVGDLKVAPGIRSPFVFLRLARAADLWARPKVMAAYGVVMQGTRASPEEYTGRVGIESFGHVGNVDVIRFQTNANLTAGRVVTTNSSQGETCYRTLSAGRYAASGGDPELRSEMIPTWLVHQDGSACGRLEDTRRAKRLIGSDGVEMNSAHLAAFAWRNVDSAVEVIHAARCLAAARGMPALFVAIDRSDRPALEASLGDVDKIIAPAAVYGAGLPKGLAWNINSSEI